MSESDREDIRTWIREGIEYEAVHLLIIKDRIIGNYYPIFILPDESIENYKAVCGTNGEIIFDEISLNDFDLTKLY